jgi:hypothetical protein
MGRTETPLTCTWRVNVNVIVNVIVDVIVNVNVIVDVLVDANRLFAFGRGTRPAFSGI